MSTPKEIADALVYDMGLEAGLRYARKLADRAAPLSYEYAAAIPLLEQRIETHKKQKAKELSELLNLHGKCNYNETNKRKFKFRGMRLLRELAEILHARGHDVTPDDVRYNPGGIAVSGDCILHGGRIYINFTMDTMPCVMYRRCKDRKDYTGEVNYWYTFRLLKISGLEGFADHIDALLKSPERKSPVNPSATFVDAAIKGDRYDSDAQG